MNETANGDFVSSTLTLAQIVDTMSNTVCPKLVVSDDFCDILMGKMTPMMFPYLYPDLDHAIYVDRTMVFQDDVGHLWRVVQKLRESGNREALAMAPEQTNHYLRAFAAWNKMNPSTKLGKPLPEGRPGYNPDLIVMDLEKLRNSPQYLNYFSERRLKSLVHNYLFHTSGEIPSLGDMVNLMAADDPSLVRQLGCEWNRNSEHVANGDVLARQFDYCDAPHGIRAWNGQPNPEKAKKDSEGKTVSIGKTTLHENELK